MANVENANLQLAIDNTSIGETVVLVEDITLSSRVTISKEITLDLNGYAIIGNIDDGYGAIYVGKNGNLTIIDSSEGQTGSIINTVQNAIGNYGVVNIYGGTFTGNYALYNFYYSDTLYGTSTIYGGTFNGVDGLAVANCGNLTVSGGVIESLDTTNVLIVSDGAINTLSIGLADYNPANQSTSINGGNINTLTVASGSNNEIAISGGTFNSAVDSTYLVDGFKITYDASTNSYGVVVDNGFKVVATSSSRIDELPLKNGQLIFVQDAKQIAFDFNNQRIFYTYDNGVVVDEAVATANKYTDEAMAIIEF